MALSRARSLNGLFFTVPFNHSNAQTSPEIIEFANGFNDDNKIESEIKEGKRIFNFLNSKHFEDVALEYYKMGLESIKKNILLKSKDNDDTTLIDLFNSSNNDQFKENIEASLMQDNKAFNCYVKAILDYKFI